MCWVDCASWFVVGTRGVWTVASSEKVSNEMTYLTSPMSSRNQFGTFLNDHGLTGEAVEIGVHRGQFARIFLDRWGGKKLYLVDPYWDAPSSYNLQSELLPEKGPSRRADYYEAQIVTDAHHTRREFILETSVTASGMFHNDGIDFVYIDGDHSQDNVLKDLLSWWPKLRAGGIIAGHDWACPGEDGGLWALGIQYAVARWAELMRVEWVYLIVEENGLPWSFYAIK